MQTVQMHRFLLNLESGDRRLADHRNGNGLDNRRSNLRIANKSQNGANRRRHIGKLLPKGIQKKSYGYIVAVNGKYIGCQPTLEGATELYAVAAKEEFGEFHRVD